MGGPNGGLGSITQAPGEADAWVSYGLARYRAADMSGAVAAMRQALRLAPDHRQAPVHLALLLRVTGGGAAAEALLRQTIQRDPTNIEARMSLARDLARDGRAAEASAWLDAPPPADEAVQRRWHLRRALILLHSGHAASATAELASIPTSARPSSELAPDWHWARLLLARAANEPSVATQEAMRMEAALHAAGPCLLPERRIEGHFDLAKFWSGVGERERAFTHWRAGHALLRPFEPFSRAAHAAFIDANIAHFGRARFARGPRASDADPAPVFIVGMPRSGTTLCEQILAAHRDVHAAGERPHLGRAFAALGGGLGANAVTRIAARGEADLDRAAGHYSRELRDLAPRAARVIDKMPGNYRYLGLVGLMLPGARVIHCVRDPRDIGFSIFTYRFYGHHPYAHDLADLGWTIAQHGRLMAHWRAVLPNATITVKLSDWVWDFDATLARVLAHLGLPRDPACARFHERDGRVRTVSRAQVRQPINARGLGRWRDYAEMLVPLYEELDRQGALADWPEVAGRGEAIN